MDFSQPRLKLRVAVCPFLVSGGPEFSSSLHHHRVVGVKRSVNETASLVILRQFLLLPPLDCTFSDLQSLVLNQYEKLYKSQPGYIQINKFCIFRDSNHCDLDSDYLVSDICASNDLIYAMVELEDLSKKMKTTSDSEISKNQDKVIGVVSSQLPATAVKVAPAKKTPAGPKPEKKVPEFKVTGKTTISKNVSTVEVNETTEVNSNSSIPSEAVKVVPSEDVKIVTSELPSVPTPLVPVQILEPSIASVKTADAERKPVPIKTAAKKATVVKAPITVESSKTSSMPAVKPIIISPPLEQSIKNEDLKVNCSVSLGSSTIATDINSAITSATSANEVITPSPTPIPRPVFNPRKSVTNFALKSSSSSLSEDSSSDDDTSDVSNLFGTPIITSEPRRSDSFVLFDAGSSSSEDEEESSSSVPSKIISSSSIVSLQAAPSSECENQASSSSDDEEGHGINNSNITSSNNQLLPQSVALKRLSSISPIPDSSEIPSLEELKESLSRAPTPVQQLQQKQQQQSNNQQQHQQHHQKPKVKKNPQSPNKIDKTPVALDADGVAGRPTKKPLGGRPKKQQVMQSPVQPQMQLQVPIPQQAPVQQESIVIHQ